MNDQTARGDGTDAYEVELESVAAESPSVAVLRTVAALANSHPESLEPLGRTVDPDALDELLDGSVDSDGRCRVTFRYGGYHVEVTAGETLRLTPLRESAGAGRERDEANHERD